MKKTKTIMVKCTFIVPVEIPDDPEYDMYFDIEENHCPSTGIVGVAFDKFYKNEDETIGCWGCALDGENEIISN